jgi:hypothetical protein
MEMVFHTWKHSKISVSADLEEALSKIVGRAELQRIYRKLDEHYNCSIIGCYDNPQYLTETLKDMYGYDKHLVILEQLKKEVNNSEHKIWFEQFMERLTSGKTRNPKARFR